MKVQEKVFSAQMKEFDERRMEKLKKSKKNNENQS